MSVLTERICAYAEKHPEFNHSQIAEAVGCARSTVTKALDPERTRGWNRRQNAKRQEAKNAWQHEFDRSEHGRGKCRICGGPRGIGQRRKRGESGCCRACLHEIAAVRGDIIAACYEEGWPVREIAELLGTTFAGLNVDLNRLRKAGRIGYRYAVGPDGKRISTKTA